MVTEIRRIGNELALYTDDNRVYRSLANWQDTLCKVPYIQGGKVVGVDLYFDKKAKSTIKRVIKGQLILDL